jgi:hypothetical protein
MYIVHINYDPPADGPKTPFTSPDEAIMGMFYMSMGR